MVNKHLLRIRRGTVDSCRDKSLCRTSWPRPILRSTESSRNCLNHAWHLGLVAKSLQGKVPFFQGKKTAKNVKKAKSGFRVRGKTCSTYDAFHTPSRSPIPLSPFSCLLPFVLSTHSYHFFYMAHGCKITFAALLVVWRRSPTRQTDSKAAFMTPCDLKITLSILPLEPVGHVQYYFV